MKEVVITALGNGRYTVIETASKLGSGVVYKTLEEAIDALRAIMTGVQ